VARIIIGEWVRTRNTRNRYYRGMRLCNACGRGTCGTVWFNLETEEVRCTKCFDPLTDHQIREGIENA
jgi:hypothetical protein